MSDTPPPLNILAFAGSLRSNSYNRRLVRAAAGAAPAGLLLTCMTPSPIFRCSTKTWKPPTRPALPGSSACARPLHPLTAC